MQSVVSRVLQALFIVGTVSACSSPSTQSAGNAAGAVNGTVAGHSLAVSDGLAAVDPGSAIPHVYVVLGNRTHLCSLYQGATGSLAAGNQVASLTSLEFHLFDQRSNTVTPGTLPVTMAGATAQGPLEADVLFSVQGANCEMMFTQWATSGTVTLSSLQPSVAGTYDVMFDADHVTGSFDVGYCDGVHVQGTGGNSPSVCQK